jgi:hypothetical protein
MAPAAALVPCGGGARAPGTQSHARRCLGQRFDTVGKAALELGFVPWIGEHVTLLVNRLVPILPGAVCIVVNDIIRD